MSDVTRILAQIDSGDPDAAEQLLPLVYDELRKLAAAKLAHERPGQTLQATALVHEAYLRAGRMASGRGRWQTRLSHSLPSLWSWLSPQPQASGVSNLGATEKFPRNCDNISPELDIPTQGTLA